MLKLESVTGEFLNSALNQLSKVKNPIRCVPFAPSSLLYGLLSVLIVLCPIHFTDANAAQVELAWKPSPGSPTGYLVYYGRSSGNYNHRVDVGNYTACTISGLQEGETYYFAASAYNAVEESNLSEELAYTIPDDPSAIESSNSLPMKFGEVQIDNNWKHINFSQSFADPVVVANPLSINGADPAVIRIRNVSSKGFEIRIQEWNYLDGIHTVENVSYLAMERGSFTLGNGDRVEADRFITDKVDTFGRVSFKQGFKKVPVVVTSITSFNGSDAVTGRVKNVDTRGFEYTLQEQESFSDGHTGESVAYIAWEPSSGTVDGITYEIGKTGKDVSHGFHTVQFKTNFKYAPVFFADMQTANGMDTANVRWQNKDAYAVEVQIDEEQSQDNEIEHFTEVVGVMAFSY